MKKFSKAALIALMLVCSVFAITACGVDEIALDSGSAPRTVYVQGQDLDLSVGSILAKSGDKEEQVALNGKGVTVTGYEKDRLGNQELTVTYKGKTVTYLVNVVARMVAENINSEYFVGETLDTSTGRLRITKDDGTNFTVLLNDSALSFTSAEFTESGTATVVAHYSGTQGNYEGSFPVNVYAADNVELVEPAKTEYKDYMEELDLTGGKLVLTGNGSKLTKEVPLTAEMVSGYEPNAVNAGNRTATQQITVSYLGREFHYDVTVTYSNLSIILDNIAPLKALDWSQDTAPAINKQTGELALQSWEAYNALDTDEFVRISTEDVEAIARAAAVYGKSLWTELATEFAPSFSVTEQGSVLIEAQSYDGVKANLPKLLDQESDLYTVLQLLYDLKQSYSALSLFGEENVESYLGAVCDPASLSGVVSRLQYMTELYETLKEIPDDWKPSQLLAKEQIMVDAVNKLSASPFVSASDRTLYRIVSEWRNSDDFFYILWYYFYNYNQNLAQRAYSVLIQFQLPGILETLYMDIQNALTAIQYLGAGMMVDASYFQYYYADAFACIDEISEIDEEEHGDQKRFYAALLNSLRFNNILASSDGQPVSVGFADLLQYLKLTEGGYIDLNLVLYGDEDYEALWQKYLSIFSKVFEGDEEYFDGTQFGTDVQAMLDAFVALTPAKQFEFLFSLSPYYGQVPVDVLAIYGGQGTPVFTALLAEYFDREFDGNESAMTAAHLLLSAVESYARRFALTDPNQGIATFLVKIGQAKQAVEDIDADVKDKFNTVLGACYTKYTAIQQRTSAGAENQKPTEDEQKKLDALANDIRHINLALRLMQGDTASGTAGLPAQSLLIAAYEDAGRIVNDILTSGSENLKNAYMYDAYEGLFTNLTASLDYAFYSLYRAYCVSLMNGMAVSAGGSAVLFWDAYYAEELGDFMVPAGEVMWSYWDYLLAQPAEETEEAPAPAEKFYDAAKTQQTMKAFLDLTLGQKTLFLYLEQVSGYWYFEGLTGYFVESLGEELGGQVANIVDATVSYIYYLADNDGHYTEEDGSAGKSFLQDFLDNMDTVIAAYEGEHAEQVKACLGDVYDEYKAIYDELKAPSAD